MDQRLLRRGEDIMLKHEHRAARHRSPGMIGTPVIRMFWLLGVISVLMVVFATHERWDLFILMVLVWCLGLASSLITYRRDLHRKTFTRLTDKRFRVTGDADDIYYLTCGVCQHDWESPGVLVREYRKLLGPDAPARGMGAALPRDQERAVLGVRCPACGAADPGVLVHG